jgi:stage V sporulation protein AD
MRLGRSTVQFEEPPSILEATSIAGKKEGEGPLSIDFDLILDDDRFGEESWEKAESKLQIEAVKRTIEKADLTEEDIDYILAGDLLNQCSAANYAMRKFDIPFLGLYGACSTMAESMMVGSMLIGGGICNKAVCVTSSHFCSAEKQYRYPLDYGGQRSPTTQWTVTGSGAALLSKDNGIAYIKSVTTGKVIDMGINDANNMGAAMAPAACDTILSVFKETNTTPDDYDLILTGDLGVIGSDLLCDMLNKRGYDIYKNHNDCGKMIYDIKNQDVHAGGSGCGCCGSVFCGHILRKLKNKEISKMLLVATGALMTPMAIFQGETIPSIAHALVITSERE